MAHILSHFEAGDPPPPVEPTRNVVATRLALVRGAEKPVTDDGATGELPAPLPSEDFDLPGLINGDEDAWRKLFQSTVRDLTCMAELRVGDDAKDVVQETFFRATRSVAQFRPNASMRAWLAGIANHVIIDLQRRQCRRPTHGDTALSEVPARDDLAEIERRLDIAAWETSMTPAVRRAYDLFYKKDMSIEAIATMTGRSVASIKQSLARAREHMRQVLL